MNKKDISRLRQNYTTFFQLGLAASLLFSIWAFSVTKYEKVNRNVEFIDFIDDIIPTTPNTDFRKTPPPPPEVKIDPIIEPIEEDPVFEDIDDKKIINEKPISKVTKFNSKETGQGEVKVKKATPKPPKKKKKKVIEKPDEIIDFVEEMPLFIDCEGATYDDKKLCADRSLLQYLQKQVNYPDMARETSIEGRAIISFVVEKDGSITNTEILRDLAAGCGKEALRVVKNMPKWALAGRQGTKKVRVRFKLPITFRLD